MNVGIWVNGVARFETSRGSVFKIRYRVPVSSESSATKRITETLRGCTKLQEARQVLALRMTQVFEGSYRSKEKKAPITLAAFWEIFHPAHFATGRRGPLKPSQRRNIKSAWRVHIEPELGHLVLTAIDDESIRAFVATLQAPRKGGKARSLKTVNEVLAILNTMLDRAERWHHAKGLPRAKLFRLDKPKVEFWELEPWRKLEAAAMHVGERQRAALLLGARAGLRASEILGVHREDVDHERKGIWVRRSLWQGQVTAPKGGRARWVPVGQTVLDAVKAVPENEGAYLFARNDARPASIETLRLWVGAIEHRAGLSLPGKSQKGRIHKLRHTFASHLVMMGVSLYYVKELLGHEHIETTMRYAHLAPSVLHGAVATLEVGFDPKAIPGRHISDITKASALVENINNYAPKNND